MGGEQIIFFCDPNNVLFQAGFDPIFWYTLCYVIDTSSPSFTFAGSHALLLLVSACIYLLINVLCY